VRRFKDRPVEKDKILACIEAARMAPSAENVQPWRFIVIDEPAVLAEFGEAVFSGIYKATRWALKAPVLIMLLADRSIIAHKIGANLQEIPFQFVDLAIAGEHLVLQAESFDLGSCWIGWLHTGKARKFFKISKKYEIGGLIALGYPENKARKRPKKLKPVEEILFFNRWGVP
jgi:nitroreductase